MKFLSGLLILLLGLSAPAPALDNPQQKVSEVIKNYIVSQHPEWAAQEIKITFKQAEKIFKELEGLTGAVELKVAEVYHDFHPAGNVIFPIEATAGASRKRVFLRTGVEVFKPVVTAARQIKRSSTITAQDVALLNRDIAMLPQSYFARADQVIGKEAKTAIPRNSTIFEWMIKEVPAVRRGEEVALIVQGPNLRVKTTGTLLEDGYLGQAVKVKAQDNSKPAEGILISSHEVEVKLK